MKITIEKHRELLMQLIVIYKSEIERLKDVKKEDYLEQCVPSPCRFGICYTLSVKLHFEEVPYWIRRHLPKKDLCITRIGYTGIEYMKYRLELLERELEVLDKWGWFARLRIFKPKLSEIDVYVN